MIRVVLFDFDGVIIDSRADIADSVNAALSHFGFLPLSMSEIIPKIGHGSKSLLLNCITDSCLKNHQTFNPNDLPKYLDWYIDYYTSHAVKKTTIYNGVIDLLDALSIQDIRMAIVSNKPLQITNEILEHFGIADYFDVIVGPETTSKIKPDPEGLCCAVKQIDKLLTAIGENHILPSEVLMVGDSAVDVQAAKAFGCYSCGCTEGIGNATELKLQNPSILVKTLADLSISALQELS